MASPAETPSAGSRPRVVVVGVAGASGSGKSTLADYLAFHFGSAESVIDLDEYFIMHKATKFVAKSGASFMNIEYPRHVDFGQLCSRVKQVAAKLGKSSASGVQLVVVEGFLLCSNAELVSLLDVIIMLRGK